MSLARQYDVIIIGGGATGAGTARDCALRGLKVLLVERKDFATGATGRNHGLLHSGARYAVTDQVSAAECVAENKIIRHIARHCVEPTDGLFVTLPEDDLGYQDTFVSACLSAGIDAEVISPDEARRIEPAVNPNLIGAVRVPDCAVDPFRLVSANLLDARLHGAEVLTYHEVVGFVRKLFNDNGVLWQMCEMGKTDAGGGGTVAIFMANRNIDVIDAGVPVLSMHAPYETVAKLDCYMTYKAMTAFFKV